MSDLSFYHAADIGPGVRDLLEPMLAEPVGATDAQVRAAVRAMESSDD